MASQVLLFLIIFPIIYRWTVELLLFLLVLFGPLMSLFCYFIYGQRPISLHDSRSHFISHKMIF